MKNSPLIGLSILALSLHGATAAVSVFDNVNLSIPNNFEGIYIDLSNNSTSTFGSLGSSNNNSFTISYAEPASGDWDFNFFFGGLGIAHNSSVNPYRADSGDNLSAIHDLGIGELIDGTTPSASGALPLLTPDFGGSGTGSGGGNGVSTSGNHVGAGPDQFEPGTVGYIGFVLDPGASETYGWMSVTFQEDGTAGMINSFVFSDDPIGVGLVPEPSSALLALLGMIPLMRRKR